MAVTSLEPPARPGRGFFLLTAQAQRATISMMKLFKRDTYEVDDEIHKYTDDIDVLLRSLREDVPEDAREQLEYNLKVMVLIQQRLMEGRG